MARPKAFDRDTAVQQAMTVFWEQGYEATSTDDLLRAMGIGRQSMYDTFGDKHQLYLEALQRYQAEYGAALVERLHATSSPLAALRAALLTVANETPGERARGCLFVNAIAELAHTDPAVASLVRAGGLLCEAALERVVRVAQRKGELDSSIDARTAGRFLFATINGLRVSAKAGATPEALRDVAELALRGLKAL
ncbi:MAG TPA: TetR/AcrR family transcriptional regulator [Chloroflexota bacterium]|jgi:AcrR family transcriptional regulator|nr:TetR/AcrR family transcriptional regulator [Chloroflexota bacterium]